uniref:Uncharacterized protein n=1 Tax=Opuntia streptacantha TaxID=393608 RepID=A0A7C9DV67_OPUST
MFPASIESSPFASYMPGVGVCTSKSLTSALTFIPSRFCDTSGTELSSVPSEVKVSVGASSPAFVSATSSTDKNPSEASSSLSSITSCSACTSDVSDTNSDNSVVFAISSIAFVFAGLPEDSSGFSL